MSPKLRSVEVMDEYLPGESQQKNGCLVVETGEASIMVWGSMSYHGIGPLTVVEGSITGETYRQTLQKHFLPLVASRRRRKKGSSQSGKGMEREKQLEMYGVASTKS